jgi:(2Fe-2S) ferredoxin
MNSPRLASACLPSPEAPAPTEARLRVAALLLARTGAHRSAAADLDALCRSLMQTGLVERVALAFSAEGSPSLHGALRALADKDIDEVWLLPLQLPLDPSFKVWIARSVQRWRAAAPALRWPVVRLAPSPADTPGIKEVMRQMLSQAQDAPALGENALFAADASLVPAQHWRLLVCQGPACNSSGGAAVWEQLRQQDARLDLRTRGRGMTACTTSCLGPCSLAPVLQVYPDGQFYGGVDEEGVGRIVQEHVLGGRVVEALAYQPNGRKQRLRPPAR